MLRIAWPLIISELGDSLYSLTDTYFVSKVGTDALAAVGLGSYISWLFFVIVAVFSMGVLVFVAQAEGAGKRAEAKVGIGESLIFSSLISSIVVTFIYPFIPDLIALIGGGAPELTRLAVKYFSIRILGLPIIAAVMVMDSGVRAVGATKFSMAANITSVAMNAVLDPILIFGLFGLPEMGVGGAALATVISITYMVPVEAYFLRRLSLTPSLRRSFSVLRKILWLGGPAAVERLVFAVGSNIYIALISRCGATALAAHQVGVRIESIIYMPGFAFSVAAASLVGRELGAGNVSKGEAYGREAVRMGVTLMTALGVFVALTAKYLAAPFSSTQEVAELASIYLILAGLSEPGLALAMASAGAIRGAGNTVVPMIINIAGLYLVRIIPAAILTHVLGVVGAWLAMFTDVWVRGVVMYSLLRMGFRSLAKKVV